MGDPPFGTVLVANRGEIAVRVMATLRRMGIRTVAVYSDADAGARHVAEADLAVRLGPAPAADSYLNLPALLSAVRLSGAEAVHPGYGFLSESPALARALAEAGVAFIGPGVPAIERMGDKIAARATVAADGVPVLPGAGRPGMSDADLLAAAADVGLPLLVKPSAGGGGKGMVLVEHAEQLPDALAASRRVARASFGDDTLLLERYVARPRHIEIQVLADHHGSVLHLGERECSLQRRHQKVVEEAPSSLLDGPARARMGAAAVAAAASVDYRGAGTVEFIVSGDAPEDFFFLEMNTRLQVEHPVTELVTGLDLVEWQVRVAAGERLPFGQSDVRLTGHAVEARVYAEDPACAFLPTGGAVLALHEPSAPGVRVDSGLSAGAVVGLDYDPMLAKVVAHAPDRDAALALLRGALAETVVLGVGTNLDFLGQVLTDPDVLAGRLSTTMLDVLAQDYRPGPAPSAVLVAAAVSVWLRRWAQAEPGDLWARPDGWRLGDRAPFTVRLQEQAEAIAVRLTGTPSAGQAQVGDEPPVPLVARDDAGVLTLELGGVRRRLRTALEADQVWLHGPQGTHRFTLAGPPRLRADGARQGPAELTSPMPGSVIAVPAGDGGQVVAGDPLVVVEAMKMEHTLRAPVDGTATVLVRVGQQVTVGQRLARVAPPEPAGGSGGRAGHQDDGLTKESRDE